MSCRAFYDTAPKGAGVRIDEAPRILNQTAVADTLSQLYQMPRLRKGVVELLVERDGRISHACMYESSGDRAFDRAVLQASTVARFRPARSRGLPVIAWIAIPVHTIVGG
jgi:TonB family protein